MRNYKIANVQLKESFEDEYTEKAYCFKCFDLSIKVGDYVVVDTQYGFAIGKVQSLSLFDKKATKEVVCVCDVDNFMMRKENQEKLHSLEEKMQERVESLQKTAVIEMLSEKDDELRNMLNMYNDLKEEL